MKTYHMFHRILITIRTTFGPDISATFFLTITLFRKVTEIKTPKLWKCNDTSEFQSLVMLFCEMVCGSDANLTGNFLGLNGWKDSGWTWGLSQLNLNSICRAIWYQAAVQNCISYIQNALISRARECLRWPGSSIFRWPCKLFSINSIHWSAKQWKLVTIYFIVLDVFLVVQRTYMTIIQS